MEVFEGYLNVESVAFVVFLDMSHTVLLWFQQY